MLSLGAAGTLKLAQTAATLVDVVVTWVDITTATGAITPGGKNTALSAISSGGADILGTVPGTGVVRNIKSIFARAKGGANTVTLIHSFDGTNASDVVSIALVTGERLQYDSDGFEVYAADGSLRVGAPLGEFVQMQRLTGNGTLTVSARTNRIRLRMVGGGGAGGSGPAAIVASAAAAGGGGGAGAYGEWWVAVTPGTGYAATVGGGGAAGAAGAVGGNGGNTTLVVGGVTYQANGGVGGAAMTPAAATALAVAGGAGGTSVTGGTPMSVVGGEPGDAGNRVSGTVAIGGKGGNSLIGPGAIATVAQGNGATPGTAGGGGGSGGLTLNGGATTVGGVGGAGLIIVEEYT
jgi:hypothetical protein